ELPDPLESAENLRFTDPDSAIALYEAEIEKSLSEQDTLTAIQGLIGLSYLYAHTARYSRSYDGYWEALLLAEQLDDQRTIASVYNKLGWLYSFYKRRKKAIDYFNLSLNINKELAQKNEIDNQIVLNDYYALATLYRKENETEMARRYLDSCLMLKVGDNPDSNPFIKAEYSYILHKEDNNQAALDSLLPVKTFFEQEDSSYLIILYPFLGDVYRSLGQLPSSESYYLRALDLSEKYSSHRDLIPEIYESLANLYVQTNQYELAHQSLATAKELSETQFGSRSEPNLGLLEIKDDYRIEKERQNDLIQQQRLLQLEQANKIRTLQAIILFGAILFLLILGLLIYRYLRARYKAEKRLLQQQKESEIQKANEVLEVKNKELTASALQAIAREELLAEVKGELLKQKQEPNPRDISKLVSNINVSNSQNWEEFELRFLSVNEGFYGRLQESFPGLSQHDHKICALIKLNFSSKDMARLLGISVESVHTTRYRLRKKLGLDRKINLEDFIAKI
ncbi:MAG: tetratricopeptide repeat protein, partial [Bacteroidota bacterium]